MKAKAGGAEVARIGTFAGLDADALDQAASLAVRRALERGKLVFGQGQPGARFHALISGWIRISQAGSDGGQALMRFVGPGQPFGSLGIFIDGCYPAEATAMTDAVELSWSEAHFRQLAERYPAISTNLLILASRRLAEVQDRLREIATQPAGQRIARTLLRLAEQRGFPPADGALEIPWPLSRRDVAALAATTIYTASRTMARWQRQGMIASAGGRVAIRSPADLARLAEGN